MPGRPAVILASSRSDSNTRSLAEWAFPPALADLEDLTVLRIAYYSYDGVYESDDFLDLIRRLQDHSLWVLATPLHWYTMSAQAKTFIDRLSDLLGPHKPEGRRLRGKSLAVLCTGADALLPPAFDEPFRLTCDYLGVNYMGSHYAQFVGRIPVPTEQREAAAAFGARCIGLVDASPIANG